MPGSGRVTIDSIGIGDLLGCSWLFPPYRWAFGAACVTAVRAFEFDAAAIRARCRPTRNSAPNSASGCCGCSPGGSRAPGHG